ncbi:MAG: hypothetical protein R2800_02665 [Flavipsychrobacter sp.]
MQRSRLYLNTFLNCFAVLLLWIHLVSLYDLWQGGVEPYYFGSAAMGGGIYTSVYTYVGHGLACVVAYIAMLLLSYYKKWNWYYILTLVAILLTLYPVFFGKE